MATNKSFNTNLYKELKTFLSNNRHLPETQRQEQLEQFMDCVGSAKFLNKEEGVSLEDAKYMNRVVQEFTEKFESYIKAEYTALTKKYKGKGGGKPPILTILNSKRMTKERIKPDGTVVKARPVKVMTLPQIAFLTTRHVLSTVREEKTKVVFTSFKLAEDIANTMQVALREGVTDKVAVWLLQSFCDCFSDYFEFKNNFFDSKSSHKTYNIIASNEWLEFVQENLNTLAELSVQILPTVAKPADWNEEGFGGGFLTTPFKRGIIKGRRNSSTKGVCQANIDSTNYLQSTAYRINPLMVYLVGHLLETKPSTLDKVFPSLIDNPWDEEFALEGSDKSWDDMSEDEKNLCRKRSIKCKAYKKSVNRRNSIEVTAINAYEQAVAFIDEKVIYFPQDLDYRCRVYNMIMTGLNTQGSDIQKCMLEFAKGRKIATSNGVKWMKINLANLLGQDKLHINDRVKWVDDNVDYIKNEVTNRLTSTEWHKWDKPLQGMACSMEYVQWLSNPNFEFHSGAQLDGKCSGVQHLTAMARDEKVAPEVGLIDTGAKGGDIYLFVLNKLTENLLNHRDTTFVNEWRESGLINRNLTKRPVMTKSYSATLYGMKQHCSETILEKSKDKCFEDLKGSSNKMGDCIWEAISGSLERQSNIMEWFQSCCKILGNAGLPFTWTNGLGSVCTHNVYKSKTKRIQVNHNGERVTLTKLVNTDELDVSKMVAACAANIIHSNDSAHLFMVLGGMQEKGMQQAWFVHDSFSTSYDDTEQLIDIIKSKWVELYSRNILEELYQDWTEQLLISGKNVSVPHYTEFTDLGTLKATDCLNSDWIFG